MTKVDFYTGSSDKLRTACQLTQKAMQNGVRVVLGMPDQSTCESMDKLLWQYSVTSFIPHGRCTDETAEQMPVLLAQDEEKFPHHELLISLYHDTPNYFSRFERVIEIISLDEEDSARGRARYKFYRDRGYALRHIDLSNKTKT